MPSQAQLDRLARLLKTTSQAEIARQMKISRGTVSNWIKKLDGKAEAKPRTATATSRPAGRERARTQARAPYAKAESPQSDLEKKATALRHEAEAIVRATTAEIARLQTQQAVARQLLEKLGEGHQEPHDGNGAREPRKKPSTRRVRVAAPVASARSVD